MDLFSSGHVGALLVMAALALAAAVLPRARPGGWVVALSRVLALIVLAAYLTDHAVAASRGIWSLRVYLPLHLSDAATIVTVLALWSARPLLVELTYLWGLTASLQAALTPDLPHDFPDVLFLTYFVTHGGVVVAALLLACGRAIAPRPGAVARAFAATAGVATLAAIGCIATGGNYMYLRRKPDDSLLDLMGPWPLYIAAVPSASHPGVVDDLARRLSQTLGIPHLALLERTEPRPPQREMANAALQAANVRGAFRVTADPPPESCLLLDDLRLSGWTLAMVGGQLRRRGSGAVFPRALATAF